MYTGQYIELKDVRLDALRQQVSVYTRWAGGKSIWLGKPVTKPSDLEVWDIDTVQIPSRNITTNGYTGQGTTTGKSLDKTAFRTKITYPAGISTGGQYAEIWLGDNRLLGPCLRAYPDVTGSQNLQFLLRNEKGQYPVNVIVTPADFNMTTSLLGEQLELILTTEMVTLADGTTSAYFGLYINGNLYKNQYIIANNVTPSQMKQDIFGANTYGGGHIQVDVFPTRPSELKSWDIESVGLSSNAFGGNASGVANGKSQDKTAFTADVILPSITDNSHESVLFIGDYVNGYGFKVKNNTVTFMHYMSGAEEAIATLTAAGAGVPGLESLVDTKMNITITTEFVNNNGTTTDAYVGLYINNVLYGGNYFRLKDKAVSSFNQQIYIYNKWAGGKTTFIGVPVTPLAQFTRWGINSVGLVEGEYYIQGGTATGESQDKKAFYSAVRFPVVDGTQQTAELWIGEQNNGLALVAENGGLSLYHWADGTTKTSLGVLSPEIAGCTTLVGTKIDIAVATEFENSNGLTTDAKIGIYINGQLYGGKSFSLYGVPVSSLKQQVYVYNRWASEQTTWLSPVLRSELKQVTPWEDLQKWTITEVGLSEGEFGGNVAGTPTGATQDGTAFVTAIKFPEGIDASHKANLFVGDYANGYSFEVVNDKVSLYHYVSGTPKLMAVLSPDAVGKASLVGSEMDLILTTEFENNDGTTTDAEVALYIDGVLYGDTYLCRLEDVPVSSLPQQVYVYNRWAGGKTIWMSPLLRAENPPITAPSTLEKWTIETVGMADGEYNVHTSDATGKTLDGKAFYTAIKFPVISDTSHNSELWFGEYANGMYLEAKNGQLTFKYVSSTTGEKVLGTLDPKLVGIESFLGQKLDIILTTEFVNNDGTTTDVNIGLYVNGAFYGTRYFKLEKVPVSSMKQQLYVSNRWAGGKTTWMWVDAQSDLQELFAKDFGLENKVVQNDTFVAQSDSASLKATAINLDLNLPDKKDNIIYFGGEECGVALQSKGNGTLGLVYVNGEGQVTDITTLDPKKVDLKSLTNQDIGLRLTFKIYESTKTLELGVFVNGQLYNQSYFTVEDVEIETLQRIIAIHAVDAKITISNAKYTELTFHDFSILDVNIDTETISPSYQRYNNYDMDLLGKTAITGTVNFPNAKGFNLVIGGDRWQGIQFNSRADGMIEVAYSPTKGSAKFFYLNPTVAGVKSLTGRDIELRVTFDLLQYSDDKADLKMGIYINGKLYNDEYFNITNVDTTVLTRTLYICAVAGPIKVESEKEPIDLSIYKLDANWKTTLGIK